MFELRCLDRRHIFSRRPVLPLHHHRLGRPRWILAPSGRSTLIPTSYHHWV